LPYKKYYLLAALSVCEALVSAGIVAVVSVGATVLLSTVEGAAAESTVVSLSVPLSPHAAKAPIAKTKRSFFILPVFVLNE
jgi:hypothetical protein